MAPLRKSIDTRNEYMNTTPFILFLLIIQQILHMMKKTSYEDCHLKTTQFRKQAKHCIRLLYYKVKDISKRCAKIHLFCTSL